MRGESIGTTAHAAESIPTKDGDKSERQITFIQERSERQSFGSSLHAVKQLTL